MLARARKERLNFGRQLASGLTFFAIGGILPEAAQAPTLGAVIGIETAELLTVTQTRPEIDVGTEVFAISCIETGAICMLAGGSAAVAAPYLFAAGLLVKGLLSAKKAYIDPENRAYYAIDATANLVQVATVGIGWAGGIEKKINLGIAGTASLLSGVKSLVFSAKEPSTVEKEVAAPYTALPGEATASEHTHAHTLQHV